MNNAAAALEESVISKLRLVIDPELGINVWDLGLIYGLEIEYRDASTTAVITMTLTTVACPLSDIIESEVSNHLAGVVDDFRIEWVWMPPWSPARLSDDGREMLRALGFSL